MRRRFARVSGTCAYRAVADSEKGPAPPPLVLDESRGPHGWGKLIIPPPPLPPLPQGLDPPLQRAPENGVFQFWSCSKEIIFYLVLKNSSKTRGVGTSPQQSFHYPWSTPIKRKNVSEMASVKNLNRRQNSPDSKSATQAYLLFLFLFLVFLQRQWNRNYETILFKFQNRWPARRGNCKRYNGRETCSETRHTPLRLLSFDWTYGFPYMKMKVFFFASLVKTSFASLTG